MSDRSRIMRFMFGAAAVLAAVALALHFSNWRREGTVNWSAAFNMAGLLVLTATGAFDPPPGRLRLALTVAALALIFPSAFLILLR